MSPSGPACSRAQASQSTIALARATSRHTSDLWARHTLATAVSLDDLGAAALNAYRRAQQGIDHRMPMLIVESLFEIFEMSLSDSSPAYMRKAHAEEHDPAYVATLSAEWLHERADYNRRYPRPTPRYDVVELSLASVV